FRRTIKDVVRVRLSRGVLERQVLAEAVLRPDRVVERERDAGLLSQAVEGADGARLSRRALVSGRVGVQVVEDMQLRYQVAVTREVEETPVRAFDFVQPVVRTRFLGGRCLRR